MADIWVPGFTRVDLGATVAGGAYDEWAHPKALWHTTESISADGAERAFRPYPPHLCYDARFRLGRQYVPLNRHSYSLRKSESDDEFCIQVELVGFAADTHIWPDEWLRNIGVDVVRPLRELAGVPDVVVWKGFHGEGEGIVLASKGSPIRLTDAELRGFSGHLGHQHAPGSGTDGDEHWDPGRLPMQKILDYSQEDDMPTVKELMDYPVRRADDPTKTSSLGGVIGWYDLHLQETNALIKAVLTAVVNDGDVDMDQLKQAAHEGAAAGARAGVAEDVIPALRPLLIELVGQDNETQADATIRKLLDVLDAGRAAAAARSATQTGT